LSVSHFGVSRIAGLSMQPGLPLSPVTVVKDSQAAANILGLQLHVLDAGGERDFDAVFKSVAQMQGAALIIASADPLFGRRDGL